MFLNVFSNEERSGLENVMNGVSLCFETHSDSLTPSIWLEYILSLLLLPFLLPLLCRYL